MKVEYHFVLFSFKFSMLFKRKNDAWRRTWKMNDNKEIVLKKTKDKKYRARRRQVSQCVITLTLTLTLLEI